MSPKQKAVLISAIQLFIAFSLSSFASSVLDDAAARTGLPYYHFALGPVLGVTVLIVSTMTLLKAGATFVGAFMPSEQPRFANAFVRCKALFATNCYVLRTLVTPLFLSLLMYFFLYDGFGLRKETAEVAEGLVFSLLLTIYLYNIPNRYRQIKERMGQSMYEIATVGRTAFWK